MFGKKAKGKSRTVRYQFALRVRSRQVDFTDHASPIGSSQYQGSVFLPTSCKSSESGVGWRETRQQLQSLCSTAVVAKYKSSKYRGQYHCNIFYMWPANSSGISLEWNQSMIIPPAQIMSCGKNTWWALRVEEALWSLTLLICVIYHTIDLPLLLYFLTINCLGPLPSRGVKLCKWRESRLRHLSRQLQRFWCLANFYNLLRLGKLNFFNMDFYRTDRTWACEYGG